MKRAVISGLTLALALGLLAGPASAATERQDFDRTVDVAADGRVKISNTNGAIRVETWDEDRVRIEAVIEARGSSASDAREALGEVEIQVDASGGDVTIRTDLPNRWFDRRSASVSYTLSIPRQARLEAKSTNGAIEVRDLGGRGEIETTNGKISVDGAGGNLVVHTTNGGIDVRDLRGALDAHTTNGGIDAEIDVGRLDDDVRLETTNGSVDLTLPADLAARLEARTSNGHISTDFDAEVRGSRYGGSKSLSADLAGGGRLIEIRTSNGSIRIRKH